MLTGAALRGHSKACWELEAGKKGLEAEKAATQSVNWANPPNKCGSAIECQGIRIHSYAFIPKGQKPWMWGGGERVCSKAHESELHPLPASGARLSGLHKKEEGRDEEETKSSNLYPLLPFLTLKPPPHPFLFLIRQPVWQQPCNLGPIFIIYFFFSVALARENKINPEFGLSTKHL